jgi:uncharacterized protein YuzE
LETIENPKTLYEGIYDELIAIGHKLEQKHKNVWTSYDQEADILYMHFKKPNRADYSEMTEDEMIIRYEKDEIIGVTVLNASKR